VSASFKSRWKTTLCNPYHSPVGRRGKRKKSERFFLTPGFPSFYSRNTIYEVLGYYHVRNILITFEKKCTRFILLANHVQQRTGICVWSAYILEIYGDIVSLHRFKKQVSEPIASSLGKYVCLDKNVALSHKIGTILSLHRCRKILVWFFLSLNR
jgi:hypothetical protein